MTIHEPDAPHGAAGAQGPRRREPLAPQAGFAAWYENRRGRGALEIGAIFVVLQIFLVLSDLTTGEFPYTSAPNMSVMTQSIPWLALLAVGSGIVIMAGEIDLSVAMNMGMAELVFLTWYSGGNSFFVSAVVAIAVGVGIGLINAALVNVLKIPSLIGTLGMFGFLWGAHQWYVGGSGQAPRVTDIDAWVVTMFTGELFAGVRAQMLWLIGIAAVVWVAIHRHWIGNHISSVGGNSSAAEAIGISPSRVRYIAFALLGLLAGLAAVLQAVQQKTLVPGSTRGIELEAIAGAIIGGTALRGGKGTIVGMVLGVAFLKSFQAIVLLGGIRFPWGLFTIDLPAFYLRLFVGLMIILFAVVNQYFDRKAK
jgi:simple sugar transport system permease protein